MDIEISTHALNLKLEDNHYYNPEDKFYDDNRESYRFNLVIDNYTITEYVNISDLEETRSSLDYIIEFAKKQENINDNTN